jgi:hypothetical protein
MDLNNIYVADCETNGLIPTVNKMHVLCIGYKSSAGEWKVKATSKKEDVVKVFCNPENIIVMHNGRRFDKPALEKVFSISITANIIDSLAIAWYIDPMRAKQGLKYGLESYGETFGVPKPKVKDNEWEGIGKEKEDYISKIEHLGGSYTDALYLQYKKEQVDHYNLMVHRCTEDVFINIKVWEFLLNKLNKVYEEDFHNRNRVIKILNWIMDCSYKQEEQRIKVDVKKTLETLAYFNSLKEEKLLILISSMPKVPKTSIVNFPKKGLYKADGSLSVAGEKYLSYVKGCGLDLFYEGPIEVIKGYEDPNPNSVKQKKDWLYSLGWKPQTFKHNRDKETNEVKIVEQIMTDEKMLCPSILKLAKVNPSIEALDGLTVLTHRIGILKSFISNMDEKETVCQGLQSLAVTMRWMHSVIVNLPRYTGRGDIRDGKWIRECLIAGEGYKIVQSDLSGIESRTSDHYTFNIDPERIKKSKQKYYDPHTEIAVFASLMTTDEEIWFKYTKERKEAEERGEDISLLTPELFGTPSEKFGELLSLQGAEAKDKMNKLKIARSAGKTCNYASLYNVGSKTLARQLEISEKAAKELIEAYWKINFSVKVATEGFITKKVDNEEWIWNPISNFWYLLRNQKDRFSVINQSSAVYCFNMWVYNCTQEGFWPVSQSHDDQLFVVSSDKADKVIQTIKNAMEKVNRQLKLNVSLDCETQIGNNVAETH